MRDFKTILTIAGSDSIGGAGIQADLKTAAAIGAYAMTAVTAVTAQNSHGVMGCEPVSAEMLRLQISTVVSDVMPDAVKIGMVPTCAQANVIAELLDKYRLRNIVVDPVMVSTSGSDLSSEETMRVMTERVMPLATLVTPNLPEMTRLSGLSLDSGRGREMACVRLMEHTGCRAVLLKGGHGPDPHILSDLLVLRQDEVLALPPGKYSFMEFSHPRIETRNTHGTGCTLSSAIASYLAKGYDLTVAVERGIEYLQGALAAGSDYCFGSKEGYGPLKHFH